MPTKHENRK